MRRSWPIPAILSLWISPLLGADKLPAMHADPSRVSVSGLSSGAFMAVQYEVAFSASTMGIGVVAGGPYNCAYVNAGGIASCMLGFPLPPLASLSKDAAAGFAALGQIDAVANVARAKVYLFSGTNDAIVASSVMDSLHEFYTLLGVKKSDMVYVHTVHAGHGFISANGGNACDATETPFVNACRSKGVLYDQPQAILTQIYGTLKPKVQTLSSAPAAFDQSAFASPLAGLAATGYVYVPQPCKAPGSQCAVHVVFHGCAQGAGEVRDAVYGKLGYNEWADSNGIIVLYPQLDPTGIPSNIEGCWDWTGYTGLDFQVQSGKQLSAVHAMVAQLAGR
jgi:poly(3-hydroxybutyrate) depolymerase